MMRSIKNITFLLLLIGTFQANTQTGTEEQLAFQYLQNQEYDKAITYYEKLFKKEGITYYNPYLLCLSKLKEVFQSQRKVDKEGLQSNTRTI